MTSHWGHGLQGQASVSAPGPEWVTVGHKQSGSEPQQGSAEVHTRRSHRGPHTIALGLVLGGL